MRSLRQFHPARLVLAPREVERENMSCARAAGVASSYSGGAAAVAARTTGKLAGEALMLHSRDRILTTHVGSLPRNEVLTDLLIRREAGEAVDGAAMASEMDRAVRDTVAAQVAAGID